MAKFAHEEGFFGLRRGPGESAQGARLRMTTEGGQTERNGTHPSHKARRVRHPGRCPQALGEAVCGSRTPETNRSEIRGDEDRCGGDGARRGILRLAARPWRAAPGRSPQNDDRKTADGAERNALFAQTAKGAAPAAMLPGCCRSRVWKNNPETNGSEIRRDEDRCGGDGARREILRLAARPWRGCAGRSPQDDERKDGRRSGTERTLRTKREGCGTHGDAPRLLAKRCVEIQLWAEGERVGNAAGGLVFAVRAAYHQRLVLTAPASLQHF